MTKHATPHRARRTPSHRAHYTVTRTTVHWYHTVYDTAHSMAHSTRHCTGTRHDTRHHSAHGMPRRMSSIWSQAPNQQMLLRCRVCCSRCCCKCKALKGRPRVSYGKKTWWLPANVEGRCGYAKQNPKRMVQFSLNAIQTVNNPRNMAPRLFLRGFLLCRPHAT